MFKLIKKICILILFLSFTKISNTLEVNSLVTTSHPLASKIGMETLKKGGNAMDAVIAAQMALNLVEPMSSGIGGGGFLLYFDKKKNTLNFYDGRETSPEKIKKEFFLDKNGNPLKFYENAIGGLSIGVPGLISMLELSHKNHGSLNWEELFVPTIKLANNGFKISKRMRNAIEKDKYLNIFTENRKYFDIKNKSVLKNTDFSETLKIISKKKSKGFYEGIIAEKIVYAIKNSEIKKGVISLNDLKKYKAEKKSPLCGKYREYKICGPSLPSAGGISILQILGILEEFKLSKKTIKEDIHLILEASKLSYKDRYKYLGDTKFSEEKIKELTSKKYLKKQSRKINKKKILGYDLKENFIPTSTTHFSIIDKEGNVASITSSIENSFGSRLMAGGFLLNNQLSDFNFKIEGDLFKNNIIEGNKKPLSSMSPTIIFDKNNNIRMVIGSPGGKSIIMYVIKTIIGVIDWEMNISQAVNFPNFTISNNNIILEKSKFDKKIKEYLINIGHPIIEKELNSGLNGFELKNKKILGIADQRRDGLAISY